MQASSISCRRRNHCQAGQKQKWSWREKPKKALTCLAEADRDDVAIACIGTDGIDGNSDAGAIVSPKTIMLAKR